jgi:Aspartate/tyrosine/aromatic aminotransferase
MKIARNVSKLGTELVYDIFAKTKKLQSEGKNIIDLSLGQSAENPPRHVIEATIKALNDGNNGYTVPNGIIECREAVSRKIKSLYNVNISPKRIFIMPGGKPTMHYAISFFGESGVEIIYPDPGFPIYQSMINYTGAKAVSYNLNNNEGFKIDANKI